ncbi:hypothetical protein TRICI_002188 [Trichomonascus ciferrii]|uniref:Uncharacterized protein n=1 Tax=Trichomonascus ciferrii TaxID=44093 RepID=A0A642V6I3_9ASCO|nr:hypothetical protein TRICI_002188 [Trichomonascus ciferrii]
METVYTVGILKSETLFKIFNCYGHTVLTLDARVNVLTTGLQDERLREALNIYRGRRVIKLLNVDFLNWRDAGGMEFQWPGRVREFVMMVTRAFNGDIHKTILAFETCEFLEFENMNVQEILNTMLGSSIWLSCRFTIPNIDALRRVRLARIDSMWLRIEEDCSTFDDGGLEIFTSWINKRYILCLRLLFPQGMKESVIFPAFKNIQKRKWVCIELVAFSGLNHATAYHLLPLFDPHTSWRMTYRGRKKKFICPILVFDDRTGMEFKYIAFSMYGNVSPDTESPSPEKEATVIEVKSCNNNDKQQSPQHQPISTQPHHQPTSTQPQHLPEESEPSQPEVQSTDHETMNYDEIDELLNLYDHQITQDLFTDEIGQNDYSIGASDGTQPTTDVELDIDLPLFEELTRTEPSIDDFLT